MLLQVKREEDLCEAFAKWKNHTKVSQGQGQSGPGSGRELQTKDKAQTNFTKLEILTPGIAMTTTWTMLCSLLAMLLQMKREVEVRKAFAKWKRYTGHSTGGPLPQNVLVKWKKYVQHSTIEQDLSPKSVQAEKDRLLREMKRQRQTDDAAAPPQDTAKMNKIGGEKRRMGKTAMGFGKVALQLCRGKAAPQNSAQDDC